MSVEHLQQLLFSGKIIDQEERYQTEEMHIYCGEKGVNFMVFMVARHSQQLLDPQQ